MNCHTTITFFCYDYEYYTAYNLLPLQKQKKDYQNKNLSNLYKKYLLTLAFHYNWYSEFNWIRDHFKDEPRAAGTRSALTLENIAKLFVS